MSCSLHWHIKDCGLHLIFWSCMQLCVHGLQCRSCGLKNEVPLRWKKKQTTKFVDVWSKDFCPCVKLNCQPYNRFIPHQLIYLEVDIVRWPRYAISFLTSDSVNLLFSQDEADSFARDCMKHRDHQRGKMLTNGSPSPSCLKVGEADILGSVKCGIGYSAELLYNNIKLYNNQPLVNGIPC